nr:MAG TPA: hypothetical protein [Caudoviricetes sp.]
MKTSRLLYRRCEPCLTPMNLRSRASRHLSMAFTSAISGTTKTKTTPLVLKEKLSNRARSTVSSQFIKA